MSASSVYGPLAAGGGSPYRPAPSLIRLPPPVPASHVRRTASGAWYTAEPYASWRRAAEVLVRSAWASPALVGPVSLHVWAVSVRPEKRPAWVPAAAWKTGARLHRPKRPDLENFLEGVADALQVPRHLRSLPHHQVRGYPLWDDGQVVHIEAWDLVGALGEEPHTLVDVREVGWVAGA